MEKERTVWLVYMLEMELSNGGFHQFFLNPSGNDWAETLEALKRIGAARISLMYHQALSVFPGCEPPKDHLERTEQLSKIGEKAEAMLDELTDEYYDLYRTEPSQDSYAKMAAYIQGEPP